MAEKIWTLKIRMWLLLAIMFAIIYGLVSAVSYLLGISNFMFYGTLAIAIVLFQYLAGPAIVGWSMKVKYVNEKEEPELHQIVEKLAKKAGIPKPKIGISDTLVPNAFAFGRWKSDSRVCVTRGILSTLNRKELEAVLGHELSHLKHRDVAIITALSVIPMLCWFLARGALFSRRRGNAALIGIFAFVLYFFTNLLVLYGSRIREYYADAGSVTLGNEPHHLASALYKLVRATARTPRQAIKEVEGLKAFFANDISKAHREIQEIAHLDLDNSGHIDQFELAQIKEKQINLRWPDKLMELLSTHPNMLKRIKRLAEMQNGS